MVMTDGVLLGLSLILIFGIAGYWLAWLLRLPALVVLFAAGLILGPGLGLIDQDALLDPVLFPAISLALGLILFQAGLTLRLEELPNVSRLVPRLILLAAPLTAAATAALAYFLLDLDFALSLLLGSLLVLPAPTVVGPLLARVGSEDRLRPLLKWEAIVLNPLGAAVAILLFEAVLAGDISQGTGAILYGVTRTLVIGVVLGAVGGLGLGWLLAGSRVPRPLRNSIVIMVLLIILLTANSLQPEAGLLALVVAGAVYANRNEHEVGPVMNFADGLHVLVAGPLLFVLAARLDPALFTTVAWIPLLLFMGLLLFAVRPLAMFLASWRSQLQTRERLFAGWAAPRGLVPVALGTVFALELQQVGHEGAAMLALVPVLTALLTATLVWLAAGPLARYLEMTPAEEAEASPVSS